MTTSESRADYVFLAAVALVVIGAVGGFLLGVDISYRGFLWQSGTRGGEAQMGAAYGSLLIGGPVGALIGIGAGVVVWRRLRDRITGTVTAGLAVAAGVLVAFIVKLVNGW